MQDLLSFILSNKDWFYKMGGGQEINRFMPARPPSSFYFLLYPSWLEPNGGGKQNSYTIVFQQEGPETYYTWMQISKTRLVRLVQVKRKNHYTQGGRPGSYWRYQRQSAQALTVTTTYCGACTSFTLPFGKRRASSRPYVNHRRRVPSIFFHLQDKQ
jgi:hypothetical protein